MKAWIYLLMVGYILGWTSLLSAQTNFIPLERGDAIERQERLMFSPGVQLSGDYRFRTSLINSSKLPESRLGTNSAEEFSYDHDIRFNLRTTVHRTISLNLELATEQESVYLADIRTSRGSRPLEPDSQEANIGARQAFLELNTHPRDRTRIGKQEVNIGDRRGKVFSGVLSGFSQLCTVGTWCYEIGAMKLSEADGDWVYFLSLDYAFWNETDSMGKALDVLRVEIFRINSTEHDIPLGRNNVPARKLSSSMMSTLEDLTTPFTSGTECRSELDDFTTDTDCKPIYFSTQEYEYWGLRLVYETPTLEIYGDLIGNNGKRKYYVYDSRHDLNRQKINGLVSELEFSYNSGEHRYTLIGMMARGDEEISDPNSAGLNYKRALTGYYEIMPGTYRGTQFYFNGGSIDLNSGTGLGHSINNTVMFGARYRYDVPESELIFRGGFYQLRRLKNVINKYGNQTKEIGNEWDNTFRFPFATHAVIEVDVNMFFPGTAFSYDDHTKPTGETSMIYHLAGRLFYTF